MSRNSVSQTALTTPGEPFARFADQESQPKLDTGFVAEDTRFAHRSAGRTGLGSTLTDGSAGR